MGGAGGEGGEGGVLSDTELNKKTMKFIRQVPQWISSFSVTCALALVRSSCIGAACCCSCERLLVH